MPVARVEFQPQNWVLRSRTAPSKGISGCNAEEHPYRTICKTPPINRVGCSDSDISSRQRTALGRRTRPSSLLAASVPQCLALQSFVGLALVCQSIRRKLFCGGQSVGGADFHVRFDSRPFPVPFRNWVDGPCERNANGEVVSGRHAAHRMGPTPVASPTMVACF
jgi:hypothetical protein